MVRISHVVNNFRINRKLWKKSFVPFVAGWFESATQLEFSLIQSDFDKKKSNDFHKTVFFLTGVYKEAFSDAILKEQFFEELSKDDKEDWKDKHGEDVMSYFNQSLITKIGLPALKMLRFVPYCFLL